MQSGRIYDRIHIICRRKNQSPIFSGWAEIARTPIQHFQNMSYREEIGSGIRKLDKAKNMLLINEFNDVVPMYLLSR